jgi:hypothetical protein
MNSRGILVDVLRVDSGRLTVNSEVPNSEVMAWLIVRLALMKS